MNSVSNTGQTTPTALQALTAGTNATSAVSPTNAADAQDRFLKLLVAQMKNQDPLNPMDNAQVTTQLAQISTVQGIDQLNSTMGKFTDQASRSSPTDSVGLIGQDVLTAGTRVAVTAGSITPIPAGVDLAADADQVKVELLSLGGEVVDTRTFTKQTAGTITLQWTGQDSKGADLATGNYTMRVTALAAGQPVTATALTSAQVVGVTQNGGTSRVALAGGTTVSLDDIKGVFRP